MNSNGVKKYKDNRPNMVSLALSDRELQAIDEYCKKFNCKSRSAVIREGAIRFVMKALIEEGTRLFGDEEFGPADAIIATSETKKSPTRDLSAGEDMPSLFDTSELDAMIAKTDEE